MSTQYLRIEHGQTASEHMDYITGTGAYKGKDEVVETASRTCRMGWSSR